MKTHFKTTWRQRLRAPSRTNLRWYIVHHPQLPTLPSRKQTSLWRPAQQECTSQGAPTYPYFSKPLKYIFFSPTSPLLVLSIPEKTLQVFRIYKSVWFEHENTSQNYLAKKGYAYHPERIIDDIFWTIHGFSTLTANNKPQIIRSKK